MAALPITAKCTDTKRDYEHSPVFVEADTRHHQDVAINDYIVSPCKVYKYIKRLWAQSLACWSRHPASPGCCHKWLHCQSLQSVQIHIRRLWAQSTVCWSRHPASPGCCHKWLCTLPILGKCTGTRQMWVVFLTCQTWSWYGMSLDLTLGISAMGGERMHVN